MPNLSSLPRPVKLRNLLGGMVLALALVVPANASAWVKEPVPAVGAFFQEGSSLSVLPDGSVRYIGAIGSSNPYTNRLIVRPPAGPVAFAPPFPTVFGQDDSDDILFLSPQDAAGNQLVVREESPYGTAFLAPGADPGAVAVSPIQQVIAIDLAPSGEAAAIVSGGSEAFLTFREAGPGGTFDTPRPLDLVGNDRSYGLGVTVDPDGGVFVLYRTEQDAAVLQSYAPPGGDFGPAQLLADIKAEDIDSIRFGQSTNGRGILAWSENVSGDSNRDQIWALTRAPGGLLGDKSLVIGLRSGRIVSPTTAAITDDGTRYVSYLDSGPISCPNNYRFGGSVLAQRGPGAAEWAQLNTPTTGNARSTIEALATAGNTIGVLTSRLAYPTNICTDKDPTSSLEVQLGQGGSLGGAETISSESITAFNGATLGRPQGFAVNAGGAAAVLVSEPQDAANNSLPFLYYQAGAPVTPPPPGKPLKAPGKIKLSGQKLVAKGGEFSFEASCTRLPGEGSKLFCSIGALLLLEEKLGGKKAKSSLASASAKGKKVKLKVIATAKTVKVPVGKSKEIPLKLNKLGKQKLAAAKKAGLKATLKVTIKRQGYATNTIEKKVKLVAAKAKGKGNKGGGGKR
jgi:hypothetical protein